MSIDREIVATDSVKAVAIVRRMEIASDPTIRQRRVIRGWFNDGRVITPTGATLTSLLTKTVRYLLNRYDNLGNRRARCFSDSLLEVISTKM